MSENDPAAPHFAPLLAVLQSVAAMDRYTDPAVDDQLVSGAIAARDAGVPPEAVIVYLRKRLHEAPLSAVGDWYRVVLVERLVARAIAAYFGGGDGLGHDTATSDVPERRVL